MLNYKKEKRVKIFNKNLVSKLTQVIESQEQVNQDPFLTMQDLS